MIKLTALAGLTLVAGLATGCGGGGAPTDASEKDFCSAFSDFTASLARVSSDDTSAQVKEVKSAVGKLADAGTPTSISDDGRAGFELFTTTVGDLDDDVSEEQLTKIGDDFSDADNKKLDAFEKYAQDTCATTEGN